MIDQYQLSGAPPTKWCPYPKFKDLPLEQHNSLNTALIHWFANDSKDMTLRANLVKVCLISYLYKKMIYK